MKKENTASRLAQIMKEKNLRQIDILNRTLPYCQQYGVKMNKSDISQYCSGKTEPNQDKLFVLGKALNVSEAWLMGYDVPMESSLSPKESSDDKSLRTLFDFINSHPDSIGYLAILCKNERIEKEYTEKSIAQKCNITLREYLDFENFYKNIGIQKIGSILSFFDFNMTFILGYLVGATGSRDEIVDIMVSQATEKDKDNMKYIASQMVKMDSEKLNYFVELLKHYLPEDETNTQNTQKFTKAMYDFHKIEHKEEDET